MNHLNCRKCGANQFTCGGYLQRVNDTGVDGIWECRPSCHAQMTDIERLLAAIEGPDEVSVNTNSGEKP